MVRTIAIFVIATMLFSALPVISAGAVSLNITSISSGTWEATAWPSTQRSGTITVTAGNTSVSGTGTLFLTELSVGNILKTTGNIQIGTVASITSDTALTLTNIPATTRNSIAYNVQGVGPADNVTVASGHTVTVAAKAINQTGTVTVNPGGTLTVSNSGAVFSTITVNGTLNGTSGGALGALTVNNGGLVTAGQNGAYTASSLTINSGGTMNIARSFTVNGATAIAGAISFSSTSITSRAMVFKGPVTLSSGATWTEPASGNGANNTYDFQDNLADNASTFTTSDSATHTFSGTSKTLSGATNTAIARVKMTGTYTNSGTLTVATLVSGTGGLTNASGGTLNFDGTVAITTLANAGTLNKTDGGPITTTLANFTNTGTLNLSGTGTIAGITNNAGGVVNLTNSGSITAFNNATASSTLNILDLSVPHFGNLTVSAAGNTVNYSGDGAQTVKPITYSNLIFSGSGAKAITMPSNVTLPGTSILASGTLSIAPTGTAKASIIGNNLGVEHLILGGLGIPSGTWGAVGSSAVNQSDTYFVGGGSLNVINDSRTPQIITFTSTPPVNPVVGGSYAPSATGGASGNPVTFTADNASICSIDGSNIVHFNANGNCVINANQDGNVNYLAATQQQSFDIKLGQVISFTSSPPVSAVVGGTTYTPSATGGASGNPVSFTIDDTASSVCSISGGIVSFDAIGTCVIDANQDGTDTYHAAPQVQQSFAVGKGAQTISFTSTAPSNATTGGPTYTPTATATSDLPVTFTIDGSASSVCSISGSVVSFDAIGTCVINANQAGDANYFAASQVQQSFSVTALNASVDIYIGGAKQNPNPYVIPLGGQLSQPFSGTFAGPVEVRSTNLQKVLASERALYGSSFSETLGVPDNQLTTKYWFSWYDGVTMRTWISIGAPATNTQDATVDIYIGGVKKNSNPFVIPPGGQISQPYQGTFAGPVEVRSTNGQNIMASERALYGNSFSETLGVPDNQLTTKYWFSWYDGVTMRTWISIGAPATNTQDATVDIYIGGVKKNSNPFVIPPGGQISQPYQGTFAGPVEVRSTNGQNIMASERALYGNSFSETLGVPDNQLTTKYWFSWYDGLTMRTWVSIGVP